MQRHVCSDRLRICILYGDSEVEEDTKAVRDICYSPTENALWNIAQHMLLHRKMSQRFFYPISLQNIVRARVFVGSLSNEGIFRVFDSPLSLAK